MPSRPSWQAWANTIAPSPVKGFAELDAADAGDQLLERLAPVGESLLAEIGAGKAEEVEGDKRGPLAAGRGAQGGEIGVAVREEHNGLAVDHGLFDGQGGHRLRDPGKPVVEQGAAATPDVDALALLSSEDPEAVVFHLMQPARPEGRAGDEGRPTGLDKSGGRVAPGTGRITPQHCSVCRGGRKRRLWPA